VLHQRAGSSALRFPNGVRDAARTRETGLGESLDWFVRHRDSVAAGLERVHVVALRVYSTAAYKSLNAPLRESQRLEPHRFPATIFYIDEGIRKLRVNELRQAEASGGNRHNEPLDLWRGLRDRRVPSELMERGGTEIAPMSTTPDIGTAIRYAVSAVPLLLKLRTSNFVERGVSLAFLSVFPEETEVCFPPLTYLSFTGKVAQHTVDGCEITVIEANAHIS